MKIEFQPQTDLERFGQTVYNLLVENFSSAYFVGGLVRDLLLMHTVSDIDLATAARPEQVASALRTAGIFADSKHKNFGVVIAQQGSLQAEITTFRNETYNGNRYPKVTFIQDIQHDSDRRDFTVNALYLQANSGQIEDFHNGLNDLAQKLLRFIGQPETRLYEDPLRIIRALRFSMTLGFDFEHETSRALKNNFHLIKKISRGRIESELKKISDKKILNCIEQVINNPETLDKFF